jgi:hypothetical protein
MINESALRDALLSLLTWRRTQYLVFSAALNELASLRETVRGLDPTFADVIEQKRKEQEETTKQIVQRQLQIFDLITEQVKSGYIC